MATKAAAPKPDALEEQYRAAKAEMEARDEAAIEAEKREEMLAEIKLNELQKEHGAKKVGRVKTHAGFVFIRAPESAWLRQFEEEWLMDGKKLEKAQRQRKASAKLASRCRLHPDANTYEAWCREHGGIPSNVGAEAAKLGNVILEEEEGKL